MLKLTRSLGTSSEPTRMASDTVDYITVQGFKSIASVEKLPLRVINLVIGANGSGKSNFIDVFALLRAIHEGRLEGYVTRASGAENLLHFGSKTTENIYIDLSFANGDRYEVRLLPTADDGLDPSKESLSGSSSRFSSLEYSEESAGGPEFSSGVYQRIREPIGSWRVYHFHDASSSSPMRKTAKVDDNRLLRPDGANLAAFLYYLRERHETVYRLIRRTIQLVAPFFDDLALAPLALKPDDIKLEWRHKRSDRYFDASSLSDGTLRFIALATLFLQPAELCPSLILVDEPELGLHPYAIEVLASLIRQASVTTQVIVSTQSSLLLDHFAPEDVLVADLVDGGTQIKRLESSQLATWLEDYSLGQLWEKNELGGQPVSG
jgi:predicted ATPase